MIHVNVWLNESKRLSELSTKLQIELSMNESPDQDELLLKSIQTFILNPTHHSKSSYETLIPHLSSLLTILYNKFGKEKVGFKSKENIIEQVNELIQIDIPNLSSFTKFINKRSKFEKESSELINKQIEFDAQCKIHSFSQDIHFHIKKIQTEYLQLGIINKNLLSERYNIEFKKKKVIQWLFMSKQKEELDNRLLSLQKSVKVWSIDLIKQFDLVEKEFIKLEEIHERRKEHDELFFGREDERIKIKEWKDEQYRIQWENERIKKMKEQERLLSEKVKPRDKTLINEWKMNRIEIELKIQKEKDEHLKWTREVQRRELKERLANSKIKQRTEQFLEKRKLPPIKPEMDWLAEYKKRFEHIQASWDRIWEFVPRDSQEEKPIDYRFNHLKDDLRSQLTQAFYESKIDPVQHPYARELLLSLAHHAKQNLKPHLQSTVTFE